MIAQFNAISEEAKGAEHRFVQLSDLERISYTHLVSFARGEVVTERPRRIAGLSYSSHSTKLESYRMPHWEVSHEILSWLPVGSDRKLIPGRSVTPPLQDLR